MALKTFNVQGGLSIGGKGDIFDANANLNLSNSIGNVTLGNISNLHIAGGNANTATLGTVSLNGDGNVTAIAISTRGDGYTIAPTITISGANSGPANATVSLFANGAINTITINSAGTGYSSGTVTASITAPSTKYLNTDGNGNLGWSEVVGTGGGGGSGTPGGSNAQVQFNDNGTFGGTDGFTFNKVSNAIIANGTITGTNFVGANLSNGNSEVAITSNANVTTSANGNVVLTITSSGDGNLITTGANVDGYINATGNIISANFVGSLANGNSNVNIPAANGNVNISAVGNANVLVVTGTGANITGTLNVSANANVGNLGTTTAIITTGNITTVNTGLVQNGNSNIAITSNANVTITANSNAVVAVTSSGDGNLRTTGVNVAGYINATGNIISANFVGSLANGNSNVRIAANGNVGISSNGQSNILLITSNGTFAQSTFQNDVTITGNLTVSGNAIYANTEVLTIEDPIIELGTGANGAILTTNDGKDRGLVLHTYGNGAAYTTSGSTPSGNTTIVLTSTSGIVAGQLVTIASNPNAIPVGTTVSTVNAGNIVVDTATTAIIADASTLQIGNDVLRFMGWSNANAEFQFYSNATVTGEIVTGTLGNVNANTFIGAVLGNLVNGNSNVRVAANANVTISANGNANVFTVTSSGDGNLQATGVNVAGYINATGSANFGGNSSTFLRILGGANNAIVRAQGDTDAGLIFSSAGTGNYVFNNGSSATVGTNTGFVVDGFGQNYLAAEGGGSGAAATLSAKGASDTNINIALVPKGTGNVTTSTNFVGTLANGNSNIAITSNANITLTATSNATMVITGTGANITGTANISGNANVGNLGTTTAIITTGNITTVNTGLVQNGNSNIAITSNANVTITANSNAVIAITSSGDGNLQTTGANITGYLDTTGNVKAANLVVKAAGSLTFTTGNSNVSSTTLTTTTATANQALAVISAADGRAVEFIVKGIDSTGLKYSAATILALIGNAANADCDFTTFAQLNTGLSTGEVTVALTDSNANITLQVTPASTNSTVWTTQYRVI